MQTEQGPGPSNERYIIAVLLSVGVLWFFSTYVFEPPPPPPETDAVADGALGAGGDGGAFPASEGASGGKAVGAVGDTGPTGAGFAAAPVDPTPAPVQQAPAREIERNWGTSDEGIDVRWSSRGGSPNHVVINAWGEPYEQDWLPTWLISGFKEGFSWKPFDMSCPEGSGVDIVQDSDRVLLPVGLDAAGPAADTADYSVVQEDGNELVFRTRRGDIEITKRYSLPDTGYRVGYTVELRNVGTQPAQVQPTFGVANTVPEAEGRYGPIPELWVDADGDVSSKPQGKLKKKEFTFEGPTSWVGVGDRYFMVGLEPTEPIDGPVRMHSLGGEEDDYFAATIDAPDLVLAPGETRSFGFQLWTGPRELDSLRADDLRMESSVDFGFFGAVALPILLFLQFIFGYVGNWGLSIILLTVVIKGVLFPLSNKSYKSMQDMQKLQPEINELREKYKEDREQLNKEMMELWKKHGVNPAGGCLPMIVQMPIWFALYRVLWNSVELYQTPFLYFCDLSLRDPIGIFPLALGVTMWLQQKFTPNTASDPAQQAVIKFMPLFFSVIMFTLPAGLVVYILVNNVLSIGQQWIIRKRHGAPVKAPAPKKDDTEDTAKDASSDGASGRKKKK